MADAPTDFEASSVDSGSVTWSWNAPEDNGDSEITKYTVYVTGPSGVTTSEDVDASPYKIDAEPDALY